MNTGTVKFYNDQKRFGFITMPESGKDIFVHESGLVDTIREGDTVTFDMIEDQRGIKAVNVKVSSGESEAPASAPEAAQAEEAQPQAQPEVQEEAPAAEEQSEQVNEEEEQPKAE